jgi:hypothetical protein
VEGRILAANAGDPKIKQDANPNSVVILLTYGDINIFLMGDATTETEQFILGWDTTDPNHTLTTQLQGRLTMLKLGHHGSRTSTGAAWVAKLQPEVLFISSDTRTFSGTSIPSSTIIDAVLEHMTVVDIFPDDASKGEHYYVQYNEDPNSPNYQKHEGKQTTKAVCTTLNLLQFTKPTEFDAFGTSWHYDVVYTTQNGNVDRNVYITPACGWDLVNKA